MPDIPDGESVEMQGSGARPYVIKNVGGVYSCTCPAWRNQSTAIEKRSCKHIRKLRGDAAEEARIGSALPSRPVKATAADGEDAAAAGPPLLLAETWDTTMDLAEWWMSEKLDGVRAYWDGTQFLSRLGNRYHAPDWFVAGLPKVPLDGELWLDRKKFQRTVSIARRQDKSEHWKELRFLVFDAPSCSGKFETRLEYVADCLNSRNLEFARMHEQRRCQSLAHLREELAAVEALGGEGLMLRQPGSMYEVGRSLTLLKIKSFRDAEATVLEHQPGKGKHKGRLGALLLQMADGTRFSVGTGFSDAERDAPPPIGSTITFRYQELSDGGVPRFPSYVGIRKDDSTGANITLPAKPTQVSKTSAPVVVTKDKADATGSGSDFTSTTARYFEFVGGTSQKFWEILREGTDVTVRYGRIGSAGQSKVKGFASESAAAAHAADLIGKKTKEGYIERPPTA